MAVKVVDAFAAYQSPLGWGSISANTPYDFLNLVTSNETDIFIGTMLWNDASPATRQQWEQAARSFYENADKGSSYPMWAAQSMRHELVIAGGARMNEGFWRAATSGEYGGDVVLLGVKYAAPLRDKEHALDVEQFTELMKPTGDGFLFDVPWGHENLILYSDDVIWQADNSNDLDSPIVTVEVPGDVLLCVFYGFADDLWADDLVAATGYSDWTQIGYFYNSWDGSALRRHHTVAFYRSCPEAGDYDLKIDRVNGDASTADHVWGIVQRIRQPDVVNIARQRHILLDALVDRGLWQGDSGETTNLHTKVKPADPSNAVNPFQVAFEIISATTAARKIGGTASGNVAQAQSWTGTGSTLFGGVRKVAFRARTVGDANQILEVRVNGDTTPPGPAFSFATRAYRVAIIGSIYKTYEVLLNQDLYVGPTSSASIEFDRPSQMREINGDDTNYIEIEVATDNPSANTTRYYRTDQNDLTLWTEDTAEDIILTLYKWDFYGIAGDLLTHVISEPIGGDVSQPEYSSILKFSLDDSLIVTPFATEYGALVKFRQNHTNNTPGITYLEFLLAEAGTAIGSWSDIRPVMNFQVASNRWGVIPGADIAAVTNWANAELWIRAGTATQDAIETQLLIYAIEVDALGPQGILPPDTLVLNPTSTIARGGWEDDAGGTTNIHLACDDQDVVSSTSYVASQDISTLTANVPSSPLRFALANPLGGDRWSGGVRLKAYVGHLNGQGFSGNDVLMVGLWEGTTPIWKFEPIPQAVIDHDQTRWFGTVPWDAMEAVSNWDNLEVRAQVVTAIPGTTVREFRIYGIGISYLGELPPPGTDAHTTDAILQATDTLTHATEARLSVIGTETHTTDANLYWIRTDTHTTDAVLQAIRTHTTDALLVQTVIFTVAVIVGPVVNVASYVLEPPPDITATALRNVTSYGEGSGGGSGSSSYSRRKKRIDRS